jgi:hypothetical protein
VVNASVSIVTQRFSTLSFTTLNSTAFEVAVSTMLQHLLGLPQDSGLRATVSSVLDAVSSVLVHFSVQIPVSSPIDAESRYCAIISGINGGYLTEALIDIDGSVYGDVNVLLSSVEGCLSCVCPSIGDIVPANVSGACRVGASSINSTHCVIGCVDDLSYFTNNTAVCYHVLDCPEGTLFDASLALPDQCRNVDECAMSPSPCANGARCTDTDGSFHCYCTGFMAGKRCDRYNEVCAANPDKCGDVACLPGLTSGTHLCNCSGGVPAMHCQPKQNDGEYTARSSSSLIPIIAAAAGGGALVLIILIVFIVRQRRTPKKPTDVISSLVVLHCRFGFNRSRYRLSVHSWG